MIIEQMTDLIGNTPMLKINPEVTGLKNIDLYAKLEMLNPFGSVKDRTAWAMVKDDLQKIKDGKMTIYENSSGNTAKSLQAIAGIHGIKFRLVSALAKVEEQKQVLQVLGAEIEEIAGASDCFDPSDSNDPQYLIERTARGRPGEIYFPSQFTNEKNPDYHEETTAQEIENDLGSVDYFIGSLGTTGSTLGISRKLKRGNDDLKSIAVVPKSNQFIPGIRKLNEMWESGLFKRDTYDEFIHLSEQDAIDGMLVLNRQCGVLCGISSGANFKGALDYLREIDAGLAERKTAVFLVCDRMEWYISYLQERRPALFGEAEKPDALSQFDDGGVHIVPEVQAEKLEQFRAEHPDMLIIDIRTSQSFALINLPGSMSMPQELFRKWIDGTNPFQGDRPILLICAVGEQSRYYAAYLRKLGCQAYNLSGGIMTWRDFAKAA